MRKIPKLTVVGAGPGDPDLITIKALKALASADVVLYDALINNDLLAHTKQDAELIFVGKRKGCYAYQQDQINELIVSRAKTDGHVVRLKGGDPFVFGRGAEEMEYAASHNIKTEIIPGISSALSVPAYQNIPLTKRGVSESFWVITGTTKEHKISKDIALAAQSTATIVILMGMGKLSEIMNEFKLQDKDELPVAVIQNGTLPEEKIGIGTVNSIQSIVEEKKLSNPAIIVVGEVVRHHLELQRIYNEVNLNQLVC